MSEFNSPIRRIFSVSELNNETKKLLEQRFFSLFVRGEVSNFSAPRSGHWYFTLKDETAQIRVVMFKQSNFRHTQPNLGDELVVSGQLSFYRERGEVQIIANQIRPAGLGDLQLKFDLLKKQLLGEGLFEKARKATIPSLPRKIAVITSPTGAVIQDIARICQRRAKSLPIILLPVHVQGELATEEICHALNLCRSINDIDLVLLARGGGSLEDFVAFNSEQVARAIAACDIPIISGVGHETDTSIADFVSDQRAATPSEAAELATAGYVQLQKQLVDNRSFLSKQIGSNILGRANRLEKLYLQLKDPVDEILQASQKLDYLESKLVHLSNIRLSEHRARLTVLNAKFAPATLNGRVTSCNQHLSENIRRLNHALLRTKNRCNEQFQKAISLLEALSPLNTMARGFSIAFGPQDEVVRSVNQVTKGDRIKIQLRDGNIESEVVEVAKKME